MNAKTGKYFHFDNDFWGEPLRCGFLDLYQIGELCCERGFKIEEHEQSVYEITYVISGSGYSYVNGEKVRVAEGDVLINSMGPIHAMEADESNIFRYTYIGFRFNENMPEEYRELKEHFDRTLWQITKDKNDILIPFMRCMDELFSKTAFSDILVRNYCEQIVILASRSEHKDRAINAKRTLVQNNVSSSVYFIIRYIEENVEEINSIKDIAETLGYNYTYLSHFFKDKTGITLQNYITYKKIERATQLLRYGELSVTRISSMLGYANVQSFSKAFRRVLGITPTEYITKQAEHNNADNKQEFPQDPLSNV